jgi:CRP-like cAMP-binding protein
LIHDAQLEVARQAIESARALGVGDAVFVPALVSLLADRDLKAAARDVLVGYGPGVVDVLAHVLMDRHESVWVRRHVPATLARIPTARTLDALLAAIEDPDGFLRYKVIAAIESVRRARPDLPMPPGLVEHQLHEETSRYYTHLTLRYNILQRDAPHAGTLLIRALDEKLARGLDRIFRLLALVHPWRDVTAARLAVEKGDARGRAGALEYLDNQLSGPIRRRVMPILDTAPMADKVRHANSVLRTRPRDVVDTIVQLIHEDDPVVAAAAIHFAATCGLGQEVRADLEFVTRRRRADHLAVTAADWALHRATGAGNSPALPSVELVDRLRSIPLFAFVSIDELFRVAERADVVRRDPGVLYQQGAPADEVLFLLEGDLQVTGGDPAGALVSAPAALNLTAALEGRPLRQTVEAIRPAVALTLSASEFLTMLADNIATAQGLFRMLLAPDAVLDRAVPTDASGAPKNSVVTDPIERAWRLRRTPLFSRATPDQLHELVGAMRETPLTAGARLWGDGTEPAIYHLIQGSVTISDSNGSAPLVAGPGSTIGVTETLTGRSSTRMATVTASGEALRLGHDELYDILADDGDLLQVIFSGVFQADSNRYPRTTE